MPRTRAGRWLLRTLVRPPYRDEAGAKGRFTRFARAQPHAIRRVAITIAGWPAQPLRIAFLSDFHSGSHSDDLARLAAIVSEAAALTPDLVLCGGDFVNMQLFGGGRIPPRAIAAVLARLDAPLSRFAVLGNHDYTYGADEVVEALQAHGITVLSDERRTLRHEHHDIDLIGLPDARKLRAGGRALLANLPSGRPTIVLAHDPFWFAHVPAGPHLTLAGHTHGGQIRFPVVGALRNASHAPLRWSYGHVVEGGRQLYVTGGLGTSAIPLRIGVPPEYAMIEVSG
ncbi:MAG: metallophosphoesterase [Alphaproteobacteria bacterium]|nr:MAG: metallophosphoesterase [Alphaproteobacteria bacterium]